MIEGDVILEDIVERWKAFDDLHLPIFIMDENKQVVYANNAIESCYGYTPDEFEIHLREIFIEEADIQRSRELIEYSFLSGVGSRIIKKHKTKYGKIIEVDIEWSVQEITGEKYVIFTIKDISLYTALKKFKNNSHLAPQNYQLFEFVISHTHLNLLVLDENYNITYVNENFIKDHNNEVLGQNIFDYYMEDIKKDTRFWQINYLNKYNNFLLIQNFNHTSHSQLHEDKVLDFYCYYINFSLKQKILLYIKDHTEVSRYKQNLKDLEEVTQNKNRLILLGEAIAGIAHEINNPLTSILTNAQLLSRKIACKETERIAKEAMRIDKIIKNLLNFSRQSQNVKGIINVKEEMEDVLLLINAKVNEHVTLNLQIDEEALVFGDPIEFNQIFVNLIQNAVAAVEDSSKKIIEIKAKALEETVEFLVSDTGCGIPEKYLNKIFDPFFTTKKVGKGTGLGLSMVFYLTNKMEGKIGVFSKKNFGTTFTITLPRYNKNITIEKNKLENPFRNRKILIIDDQYLVLEALKEMLETVEGIVAIENDPIKGFQMIMDTDFDLVLLDIQMPLLNGLEIYKALDSYGYDVKKIILMDEILDKEAKKVCNSQNCIQKPFTLDKLKCILTS